MGIFDGYLICSDCDGTMTDRHGVLHRKDAEAINYFQQEGGLFTFATGRFPKYIDNFLKDFRPNTYQVMANGTTLYDVDHHAVIYEVTMEPPRELLSFVIDNHLCNLIYADHLNHSLAWCRTEEQSRRLKEAGRGDTPTDPESLYAPDPEPWHKINFCFDSPEQTEKAEKLLHERFPEENIVRSWSTGLELLPREGGKGPCVRKLRQLLGDRIHTVIGVGDYENDNSLLQEADIGYAVANASEKTKAVADRITVSNDDHAISAIVMELKKEIEMHV
ncbi:MAG: HAD family phosphatase [Lachnospiraceae bacterium]|nr:HAD family phosphatase [Lachnospiraceae bacterium]